MENACSTTQICTICKEDKDLDQFGLRNTTGRPYQQCRSCKTKIATKWNSKNAIRRLTVHAKTRSKKFGLVYEINYEWVRENIQPQCPCCKKPYIMGQSQGRGRIRESRPSLDRFDSLLGYTKANTRIICFRCNRTKNEGTLEDHENIVKWMRAGGPLNEV